MDPISTIVLSAFISAVISWSVETSAEAASQWLRELWAKRKGDNKSNPAKPPKDKNIDRGGR
jgi:hypothetical protein